MIAPACPYCEAVGGACWPHRSGVLRLLGVPAYRETILAFGAEGGPETRRVAPAPTPPPAASPVFPAAPYRSRDDFLAPVRRDRNGDAIPWQAKPWEGTAARKPWDYPALAALVHLDQVELLELVIETLRMQTVRPWIHVVDTGSSEANRERLRALELSCEDVQIDYLNPRAWQTTSLPVAVAMDLIFAACPIGVDHLYATHVDVFLKSRDFLGYLRDRCDASTPVVGYQMSERTGGHAGLWPIIPSHTASIYHMPTMRKIGASWSMVRAAERLGISPRDFRAVTGWPDTETNLGLDLRDAGIGMRWLAADGSDPGKPGPGDPPSWLCIGPEPNEPYDTPWLRHERSYTSHATYAPAHAETRAARVAASMADARARLAEWSAPAPSPSPTPATATKGAEIAERSRLAMLARACPDRGCQVGCQKAECRRFGGLKYLSDCIECVRGEVPI